MGDTVEFKSGAVRSADAESVRYDLISPIALEALARANAEGSAKYGDFNWEKGMPVNDLLNHVVRHIYKFLGGDRSEDHLGHAMWGVGAAIHSYALWPDINNGTLRSVGCGVPIHNEMRCENGRRAEQVPEYSSYEWSDSFFKRFSEGRRSEADGKSGSVDRSSVKDPGANGERDATLNAWDRNWVDAKRLAERRVSVGDCGDWPDSDTE